MYLNNEFRKNFNEIYRKEIIPLIFQEEEYRKDRCLNSIFISSFASLIYLLPAGIILFVLERFFLNIIMLEQSLNIFNCLLLLLPILLAYVIGRMIYLKVKEYSLEGKNERFKSYLKLSILNDKILRNFNMKAITYTPEEHYYYESLLRKSGLYGDKEEIDINDAYQGKYNDVQYVLLDLRTQNASWHNVFIPAKKTCAIIFNLNDSVKNKTVIKCKTLKNLLKLSLFPITCNLKSDFLFKASVFFFIPLIICYVVFCTNWLQELSQKDILMEFYFNFIGWLSVIMLIVFIIDFISDLIKHPIKIIKNDMQSMKLEDPKFNNMYLISTNDQVEGRYRVTTAFMDRLMNLKTNFEAKGVNASFYYDNLIVQLDTKKDLFEIGDLWHSLTNIKHNMYFYNEVNSMLDMIEHFKLDEKTGL